ncbi:MAG: DUF427 domain-containing protein [Actinomycetota bacterium]|nr:DUF427 domain-containing protein [Actinomycetota bacterium]
MLDRVFVEPTPRWIRVRADDELVADSRRALLLVQYGPGGLPTYYVPLDDVRQGALVDAHDDHQRGVRRWSVDAGGTRVRDAAWASLDPAAELSALGGHVTFPWHRLEWYEEEEPVFVHARDPYKRVDVVRSSRHVQVEVDGHTVADSSRPLLLFETSLPTRYYLPPEDVRTDLLEPTSTTSMCPYKGTARYWSIRVGDTVVKDSVWSYPEPIPENPRIRGSLCFFNERVDLVVDGERLERPVTPWS